MNEPAGGARTPGAGGSLRLEVIGGNAVGSTIVIEDELLIGRLAEGAGKLAEDPELSRQHARITREATGTYAIEDLGSTNGTFVKGLKIGSPELLTVGDTIEVGGTILVVRAALTPAPGAGEEPIGGPFGGTAMSPVARIPEAAEPAAVPQQGAPESAPPLTPAPQPPAAAEPPAPLTPAPEPEPPLQSAVVPEQFTPAPQPEPPLEPTAVPEPPPPAVAAPPPVTLRLEIDFASREARMFIDDASEPIRLVHDGDSGWRIEPGSS